MIDMAQNKKLKLGPKKIMQKKVRGSLFYTWDLMECKYVF